MDYYEVDFTGLPRAGEPYSLGGRETEDGKTGMLVQFDGKFYSSYLIVGIRPVLVGETRRMKLIMGLHPVEKGDHVKFFTSPSEHVGNGLIVDRKSDAS